MPMRMFVAVLPPQEVIEHLAESVEPRREADSPLRWSALDQWHITLAFLPSVSDLRVDDLIDLLTETAGKRAAFTLNVHGAGSFPNPAQAKVLWAGVGGDTGLLERLAASTRSAAVRAGNEVDGSKFRPHVTLARTNRPLDVTRWLRVLDLYAGPSWQVGDIGLVQSHLGGGRPRYQVHQSFPLGTADG